MPVTVSAPHRDPATPDPGDAPRGAATASAGAVALRGVGRSFAVDGSRARRTVLRDVDLDLAAGDVVAVLGPSGCGKSTLLRQVSGLDRPDVGSILIDGTPVRDVDQRSAVAFQEPRLLPWRTIRANVRLGLPRDVPRAEGDARVRDLLELTGLAEAADLRPRQVSGGMAQRASLARALARRPRVLVLDEPFGALDALTRLRMQDLLLDVHAAIPTTVLLVTHDVDEALHLADRVVLLGPDTAEGAAPGATVRRVLDVPGARPRDRGDATLAALRAELLEGLGVPGHRAR
ncbi:ABC transporter ATP-binding protein [Clavibacter michiganensis]|uniref:Bicarbonate transport ATP-binding protein CmpD n=1 Tax=Clavibacter michiganensis TaxID=28447 RepID=A0A251YUG6_9MICO|nr:ABC transporter ATP-binding protein [Clavibacter michiganensis]OUE27783.1 Bicarbonate transport ATP-binding protein CmpD [Clavibacter michiganensis]